MACAQRMVDVGHVVDATFALDELPVEFVVLLLLQAAAAVRLEVAPKHQALLTAVAAY